MGIIKTAMLAGAGMYAVNKVAKGYQQSQAQRPQPQQQAYYDAPQNYSNEGSLQQQKQRVTPMDFNDRRDSPQQNRNQNQQPQYLLTNSSTAPVPNYGYNTQDGYYYEPDSRAQRASSPVYASAGGIPPLYQQYRQLPQRGYVEDDEVAPEAGFAQGSRSNASGGGSAALLNTLMQQAGGLSDGKGKDFLGKFLK